MHVKDKLKDLKAAGLPHCDWRTLFEEKEPLPAEEAAAMDAYFVHFLSPGVCVCCGAQQGGDVIAGLLGTAKFVWGIAHGEGHCSDCGYPARAYHRDVGPIKFLPAILQYHPDELVASHPERSEATQEAPHGRGVGAP